MGGRRVGVGMEGDRQGSSREGVVKGRGGEGDFWNVAEIRGKDGEFWREVKDWDIVVMSET